MIPLEDFFKKPDKIMLRLSPGGTRLAYLEPYERRLNVLVRDLASGETRRVTEATERDIAAFFERFGGLSFRADGRGEATARALGVLCASPWFWLRGGPGWLRRWLGRLVPGRPFEAARLLAAEVAPGAGRM